MGPPPPFDALAALLLEEPDLACRPYALKLCATPTNFISIVRYGSVSAELFRMAMEGDPSDWDRVALENMDEVLAEDCTVAICDRCKKRCEDAAVGRKEPPLEWLAFLSIGIPNSDSILLAT